MSILQFNLDSPNEAIMHLPQIVTHLVVKNKMWHKEGQRQHYLDKATLISEEIKPTVPTYVQCVVTTIIQVFVDFDLQLCSRVNGITSCPAVILILFFCRKHVFSLLHDEQEKRKSIVSSMLSSLCNAYKVCSYILQGTTINLTISMYPRPAQMWIYCQKDLHNRLIIVNNCLILELLVPVVLWVNLAVFNFHFPNI